MIFSIPKFKLSGRTEFKVGDRITIDIKTSKFKHSSRGKHIIIRIDNNDFVIAAPLQYIKPTQTKE